MFDPSTIEFSEADFSGQARLFPLPNLVVFPNVLQALHIFEPRYRQMMRDAVSGDKLLAMCLLKPGWEPEYDRRADVHEIACLGRIASWTELSDGKFNLLLAGLRRVKITNELENNRPYREAEVEVCQESMGVPPLRQEELRRRLEASFKRLHSKSTAPGKPRPISKLFETPLSLAVLTDILGYSLNFDLPLKQRLLSEPCPAVRAEILLTHLPRATSIDPDAKAFPPDFSDN